MKALVLTAAMLFVSSTAVAAPTAAAAPPSRFVLADHGTLELAVPGAWQSEVRIPPDRLPPTIRFTAKSGHPFEILVTTLWPVDGKAPPADAATLRAEVESGVGEVRDHAVERDIPIREIKGSSATGYYFAVTDRAPNPGEYKYLTQGILPVGHLVLAFTILTNDGEANVVAQALAALRGASVRDGPSAK